MQGQPLNHDNKEEHNLLCDSKQKQPLLEQPLVLDKKQQTESFLLDLIAIIVHLVSSIIASFHTFPIPVHHLNLMHDDDFPSYSFLLKSQFLYMLIFHPWIALPSTAKAASPIASERLGWG